MKILAIETSCDETALAIVDANGGKELPDFRVLKTELHSQIEAHKEYGGVYPSLAKREHAKNLVPLLDALLDSYKNGDSEESDTFKISKREWRKIEKILEREPELYGSFKEFIEKEARPDIDLITVTSGPGLEPALWVGINFAKALSEIWDIPVLPVNHMEGHIVSVLTETKISQFPALALLISGGHTELVLIESWGKYKILGQTRDDAVGEAYDKVARLLDLPYPGGPEISRLASEARKESNKKDLQNEEIKFPRPMQNTDDFDFSLSGLKTSVMYKVKDLEEAGTLSEDTKKIVAREFEESIKDVLVTKTKKALMKTHARTLIVGGGVIANEYLRHNLSRAAENIGARAVFPKRELSTDNAVMIAMAGYLKSFRDKAKINPDIEADGNLRVDK